MEVLLKHILLPQMEEFRCVGVVTIDQRAVHHLLQPSLLREELQYACIPLSEGIKVGLESFFKAVADDAHVGRHDYAGLQIADAADGGLKLGDIGIGMAVPGPEGGEVDIEGEEDLESGLQEAVGIAGMTGAVDSQEFH